MSEAFYLKKDNRFVLALPFSGKIDADLIKKMTVRLDTDFFLENQEEGYFFSLCNFSKEEFEDLFGEIEEECENVLWRMFEEIEGKIRSLNVNKEECDQVRIISVEFHGSDELEKLKANMNDPDSLN